MNAILIILIVFLIITNFITYKLGEKNTSKANEKIQNLQKLVKAYEDGLIKK